MAARKQLWHPDEVRQKIQASQLINRLMTHINSDTPIMDSSQVTAATKLLNKVLPDLSAVDLSGEVKHEAGAELRALLEGLNGRTRGLPSGS